MGLGGRVLPALDLRLGGVFYEFDEGGKVFKETVPFLYSHIYHVEPLDEPALLFFLLLFIHDLFLLFYLLRHGHLLFFRFVIDTNQYTYFQIVSSCSFAFAQDKPRNDRYMLIDAYHPSIVILPTFSPSLQNFPVFGSPSLHPHR